jgi:CDP-diacylglycerol--glycerol-3-phosphate 3-phosphatidyltransferase
MTGLKDLNCLELSSRYHVHCLYEPHEFLTTVLEGIASSQDEIILSALYFGTGEIERKVVEALIDALNDPKRPNLKVTIILDHSRAQRGDKNSVTTLVPLIEAHHPRATVLLYQVPQLRGFLQSFIKFQFRELFGVYHVKFAVFDNKALLTGANLSHEYFTARQDRYFLVTPATAANTATDDNTSAVTDSSAPLAENTENVFVKYYTAFLTAVRKDSFELVRNKQVVKPPRWDTKELRDEVRSEISQLCRISSRQGTGGKPAATMFHPVVQLRSLGITQESDALTGMCAPTSQGGLPGDLHIATPYSNFIPPFFNTLMDRASKDSQSAITFAVPTVPAHGFGSAKGWVRFVPALHHYSLHKPLERYKARHPEVTGPHVMYFMRPKFAYHTKGMWWFPSAADAVKNSPSADKQATAPVVTYVGSSNFSERSWFGDLELGFIISTTEPSLQRLFRREHAILMQHCGVATEADRAALQQFAPGASLPAVPAGLFPQFSNWQSQGLYLVASILKRVL